MDPLIRSAALSGARTRLSATSARKPGPPQHNPLTPREAWKVEIEKQVRAELAAQQKAVYASERETGYEDGYAEGLSAAKAAADKELELQRAALADRLQEALSALEQVHRACLAELQANVGEVAFAAVCRLLGQRSASQAVVLNVVEQICAQLDAGASAAVRVHPRDIDMLTELQREAGSRLESLGLKLVADETLQLGGCVVETASGHYDGSLETQLRRMHAVLSGAGE